MKSRWAVLQYAVCMPLRNATGDACTYGTAASGAAVVRDVLGVQVVADGQDGHAVLSLAVDHRWRQAPLPSGHGGQRRRPPGVKQPVVLLGFLPNNPIQTNLDWTANQLLAWFSLQKRKKWRTFRY